MEYLVLGYHFELLHCSSVSARNAFVEGNFSRAAYSKAEEYALVLYKHYLKVP